MAWPHALDKMQCMLSTFQRQKETKTCSIQKVSENKGFKLQNQHKTLELGNNQKEVTSFIYKQLAGYKEVRNLSINDLTNMRYVFERTVK